jgi:ADP-ribosylglycohydrolase
MDWLTADFLAAELRQRREEGCPVADLEARLTQLQAQGAVPARALLQLWEEATARTPAPDFPYDEPSDLATIRERRPPGPRRLRGPVSDLEDRLYGAWLGRAAGCLLGKPVEGWSRDRIRKVLEHAGAYPLTDYFPWVDNPPPDADYRQRPRNLFRGFITHMVRDDDMDYPLIGLKVLETVGPDFTSQDIAQAWLTSLPYQLVYTAERVAYRNLVNGLEPPATATYRNPYREWIGAQIRADIWGWINPGWPERAAEMAYRDARVSHVKNGLYGAMFVAAMLSAAFVTRDPHEIVAIGLSEIPATSRLAEAVRQVVRWCAEDRDWQLTTDRILAAYGHYHWVHTINNAALIVMGFLYAEGELEPAITRTVMGGFDTDCTGATVGSLIGVLRGARGLPAKWVGPLNDRLESIVVGMTDNRFSDLARRTAVFARAALA